jgi:putative tryptophan/tyrosine transport system substrate-binding protein
MRRRDFINLLAGAAVGWPRAMHAEQTSKTIGVLGAASAAAWAAPVKGFEERLRELGWAGGRNVTIAYRWAEGDSGRYAAIAAEFVEMKVDVILTVGSAAPRVMQATRTIPIVLAAAVDPVASGFVDSLAHPGRNVTGLSLQSSEIANKRLEILREAIPGLDRLAVLANAGYAGAARESAAVQETARALGLAVESPRIVAAGDIAPAIASLKEGTKALYVCTDSLVITNWRNINAAARASRMATMWGAREYIKSEGGLISYGPNEIDQFRQAADYVDKILRGAKAEDIPVAQPTKIDLAVNLQTAKALGWTIPETFLLRADEVIE